MNFDYRSVVSDTVDLLTRNTRFASNDAPAPVHRLYIQ